FHLLCCVLYGLKNWFSSGVCCGSLAFDHRVRQDRISRRPGIFCFLVPLFRHPMFQRPQEALTDDSIMSRLGSILVVTLSKRSDFLGDGFQILKTGDDVGYHTHQLLRLSFYLAFEEMSDARCYFEQVLIKQFACFLSI